MTRLLVRLFVALVVCVLLAACGDDDARRPARHQRDVDPAEHDASLSNDPEETLANYGWELLKGEDGVVVSASSENGFAGDSLLAAVASFEKLQELTVDGDSVTDEGLKHLAGLRELTSLTLSSSQITGEGLAHLTSLKNLRVLSIDSGPEQIATGLSPLAALENLRILELGPVTGAAFRELPTLPEWAGLVVETKLLDDDLKTIGQFKSLEYLTLIPPDRGKSQLRGHGLRFLAGLNKLQEIAARDHPLTDDGLAQLPPLPKLKTLWLVGTQVHGEVLSNLRKMPALEKIALIGAPVTSLKDIAACPSLKSLYLHRTTVDDQAVAALADATSLTFLDLSKTQITDAALAHLAKVATLKNLVLADTAVTDAGVAKLRAAMPELDIYGRE